MHMVDSTVKTKTMFKIIFKPSRKRKLTYKLLRNQANLELCNQAYIVNKTGIIDFLWNIQ